MSTKPVMYWNKLCPFVHRSWIAAVEKGADIEYTHIDLGDAKPEWYTKDINPRGTVPAYKDEKGQILHESLPIAEYIDAKFGPKNQLTGNDPVIRAKINVFNAEAGELIGSMYGLLMQNTDEKRKAVVDNLKYMEKLFKGSQNDGRGAFFLGSTFSMADVSLVPFFIRFNATLKAYCNFDLAAEAPWADELRKASLQRHSVASTTMSNEYYIKVYIGYANRPSTYPKATLYFGKMCPYAHRARIAAAYKGLVGGDDSLINLEEVPLPPPESFLKINPAGTVPALVTGAGDLIQESNVIVEYINDAYKGNGDDIVPADQPDLICQAKLFISEYGNFQGGAFKYLAAPPGDAKAAALKELKDDGKYMENLMADIQKSSGAGPWVLGEKFSFADAIALPFLFRLDATANDDRLGAGYNFFAEHPRFGKLLEAAKANEGIKSTLLPAEEYAAALKMFIGA